MKRPVSEIQKFKEAKLGTLWISTQGCVARLRRLTNGTTLEGTLYLLVLSKDKVLFKVNSQNWKPKPVETPQQHSPITSIPTTNK